MTDKRQSEVDELVRAAHEVSIDLESVRVPELSFHKIERMRAVLRKFLPAPAALKPFQPEEWR